MSGRGLMLTYQIRVGHSVLGIPFPKYLAFWASPSHITAAPIPRYPPGMPKSLVFWSSPPKKFWISRENRKRFRDGFR